MAKILHAGWEFALAESTFRSSDNPPAPPAYAWGPEGVSRRNLWHDTYGGEEGDGWKKTIE